MKPGGKTSGWICLQLGAREHYAVPRALQRVGALDWLITDTWVPPHHPLGTIKANLRQRFHPELKNARVKAASFGSVAFELRAKLSGRNGWPLVMARNERFQRLGVRHLSKLSASQGFNASAFRPVLFAYSYAALEVFHYAKQRGWRIVLGQIDPGLHHERIVTAAVGAEESPSQRPPLVYWEHWHRECELADTIVVNSNWSRNALIEVGVQAEKLHTVPLAYEPPGEAANFEKQYPPQFTFERPLRVLFLGQVNLRKGVGPLLAAMRALAKEPVEFWFVGPVQIKVLADLRERPNARWFGPVPRVQTGKFYREADVFLFPTLSDGFGLTQIEAQAWKLPVIASKFCGEVVKDGVNGMVLPEVSGEAIASAVASLVYAPERLRAMAQASGVDPRFHLESIAAMLTAI